MSAGQTASGTWQDWLVARPIAHRGLHDSDKGIIENTLEAAEAAIARSFAIECDVQLTRDGEAIVFHDFALDRLTGTKGAVADHTARDIAALSVTGAQSRVVTLSAFLDAIAGRVPLVVEIKSAFNGDTRLAQRTARIVAERKVPVAIKSFDPAVITALRQNAASLNIAGVPLGIVAEASYDGKYWSALDDDTRRNLRLFSHWRQTRPDFLSWHVNDLPHVTPTLLSQAAGLPVMTWTVRSESQLKAARQWADQIVFEETGGLRIE